MKATTMFFFIVTLASVIAMPANGVTIPVKLDSRYALVSGRVAGVFGPCIPTIVCVLLIEVYVRLLWDATVT